MFFLLFPFPPFFFSTFSTSSDPSLSSLLYCKHHQLSSFLSSSFKDPSSPLPPLLFSFQLACPAYIHHCLLTIGLERRIVGGAGSSSPREGLLIRHGGPSADDTRASRRVRRRRRRGGRRRQVGRHARRRAPLPGPPPPAQPAERVPATGILARSRLELDGTRVREQVLLLLLLLQRLLLRLEAVSELQILLEESSAVECLVHCGHFGGHHERK